MLRRVFGWSYPPGVTGNEPEISGEYGPCEICGQDVDYCICPECPVCGGVGDPYCYINHGLRRSEEQKFLKEIAKREWGAEAEYFNSLYQL